MLQNKEDEQKFKKLGVSSVLDLALIVPSSYEDLRLHKSLSVGSFGVVDATINHMSRTPKSIQMQLYSHNVNITLKAVIFAPKPYMLRQFLVNERYYLYGNIDYLDGGYTLIQPKKVTHIGKIIPKYKTKLRTDILQKLMIKYLTRENLKTEGLKEQVITKILEIHFPLQQILKKKNIGFLPEYIHDLKYLELFNNLKQLHTKRRYFLARYKLTSSPKAWQATLPFNLTDEQLRAIKDIQNDLAKDVAAKRMIVGDVGSGKTMVIFAAVMMARPHKVALMAPTTLLANQLYDEALKFLLDIKTVLVTNKTSKKDLSNYDFIIGTHAILYRDLPQIELIMIDEQHRFGTAQRNLLSRLVGLGEKRAHFLQFSATPIPRTQAMIQSSYIDVSLITKTPFKQDITSKIIHKDDFSNLLKHIKCEIAKKHQILLVYPLVEKSEAFIYQSISEARSFWQDRFENVYITHGGDKDKDKVLLNFRENGDILIATTVVEVGISLERLSTVVIVGAERLGLSTLHQLRGRVSRNGLKGYCFLFTYQKNSDRLEQFCKTKSGFDIAQLDLKFRKSGNILTGINQSGLEFKWVDLSEDENIIKEVKKDLK